MVEKISPQASIQPNTTNVYSSKYLSMPSYNAAQKQDTFETKQDNTTEAKPQTASQNKENKEGKTKKGKKVIAVPRLHIYGEHVNDHQKEIVETYNKKGYIIGVKGVGGLEKALTKVKDFEPKPLQSNNQKMLNLISDFIDRDLGDGPQNPSI